MEIKCGSGMLLPGVYCGPVDCEIHGKQVQGICNYRNWSNGMIMGMCEICYNRNVQEMKEAEERLK